MIRALFVLSVFTVALAYNGGWDPRYCCYPPGDACCPPQGCPQCADVAIVIDRSGSIGDWRWDNKVVPFLELFATSTEWDIGFADDQYQVGITSFSNSAEMRVFWGSPETSDTDSLVAAIGALVDVDSTGITNTGEGMKRARQLLIESEDNREDCPDICIVVTDGQILEINEGHPNFNEQLPLFQQACDIVIAVGIESSAFMIEELQLMATSDDLVVLVDAFNQLEAKFPEIQADICNAGNYITTQADCCPYDYPFYARLF